ncbi:translation initiation factor IF-2 [Fusarium irregulare]|uniref:Translation initiation factor IF-2, mitochondrial n=1 Tax=Fusarium irregulare TaxID=2494466 RepID=A0A9W8Q2B0_9HYPO|nr:translation initiation factor IF-2 [Fusarium irregulare]KAJ4023986.1 translation initiation factor IF-2 [Fusarium irregulare]
MLRARNFQERGNSYVCAFCRHKLSPRDSQLRDRHVSSIAASITSVRATGLSSCHPSRISGVRSLSTSSALRGPDDNGKPGGFTGGFAGGFGAGLGSFGAFANKPAPDVAKQSGELLPHELEARVKMGLPLKKPPPKPAQAQAKDNAKTSPAPQNTPQNKGQGKRLDQGRNQRMKGAQQSNWFNERSNNFKQQQTGQAEQSQRLQEAKPAGPVSNPLSSSILAEAFKTDRTPAPVATPRSWSNNEPPKPATSAWGAFASRKVDTHVPLMQGQAKAKPTENRPEAQPKQPFQSTNKGGENVWGQLKRSRRSNDEKTPGQDAGFWDALESRVTNIRNRPAPDPEVTELYQSALQSDGLLSPEAQQPQEDQPRRKSRFEMEEEEERNRRDKKGKRQKNVRQSDYEDEDMDEDAIRRWESRQRKKAEKEAKKHLEQPVEAAPVPIFLPEYISVSNLANALQIRVADFLHDLESMGFEEITEETIMTGDTAALVAQEYGFDPTVDTGSERDLRPRPAPEDPSLLPSRPPVVTIMGHVDHGKTTLLDWLRKSSIAAQEHGGITQHIGAFIVQMSSGSQITFLDTPGHAAFLSMRQRGANVTDIVVLVVAADDSVMPQTLEALKHATAAKVPIIVAINKIDKEDAQVDQVKADLARHGVEIEDYGGDVQVVPVSGKTGKGMEDLEESIVTLSEILDVRAEADGMAEGWILESSVKHTGKTATVLIKRGTLRLGDVIVAGKSWARIRGLRNEAGVDIREAPPGTPVQVLGWRELPDAGEMVLQAPDEGKAKTAVEYREEMAERQESSKQLAEQEQRQREKAAAEEAAAAAEAEGVEAEPVTNEPGILFQNFIVKADVAGSVEAVCGTVQELGSNEVQSKILRSGVGAISEYDVDHATASKSIIVNFNIPILPHIRQRADEAGVRIIDHSVIYHVVDDVKSALSDLLPYNITHKVLGEADVLQLFSINVRKRVSKNIAGCKIRNGSVKRTSMVKVIRGGEIIFDGKIDTLKHVKKDVMEMGKGAECGIGLEGFEDLRIDDQIQTYEEIKEKRTL